MNSMYIKLVTVLFCIGSCFSFGEEALNAESILKSAVENIPKENYVFTGRLQKRRKRGRIVAESPFIINAKLKKSPYEITFTVGNKPESVSMVIKWSDASKPQIIFNSKGKKDINIASEIKDFDVTWADISFVYLWMSSPSLVGSEEIRGIDCYILEANKDMNKNYPYDKVRLWIGKKNSGIVKAEGYIGGILKRKMLVSSLVKIDDLYYPAEIKIKIYPDKYRTYILIDKTEKE